MGSKLPPNMLLGLLAPFAKSPSLPNLGEMRQNTSAHADELERALEATE